MKTKIDFGEIILNILAGLFAFIWELMAGLVVVCIIVFIIVLVVLLVIFVVWLFQNGLSELGEVLWCGAKGC